MASYTFWLGGDGNYHYRKHLDGTWNGSSGTTSSESLSSSFSTLAQLQAAIQTAVFADTSWSEVAS